MDPGALGQQPSLPGDFRPVRNPVTENKAPEECSPELTSGFPMCTRPHTDTCAGGCRGSEVAVICTAPSFLKAGLVLSVGLGLGGGGLRRPSGVDVRLALVLWDICLEPYF